MKEALARDEICRVGRSLFERGYVHSTAGNISVRLDVEEGGGYLMTPTDSCLGFLEPSRLALLDREGNQVSGDRASKTIVLHRRIYEATVGTKTQAGSVIHTHSTHCVALTIRGAEHCFRGPDGEQELLPPLTPYFVMKFGHVPVIPYFRPGNPAAAERVVSTPPPAVYGTMIRTGLEGKASWAIACPQSARLAMHPKAAMQHGATRVGHRSSARDKVVTSWVCGGETASAPRMPAR